MSDDDDAGSREDAPGDGDGARPTGVPGDAGDSPDVDEEEVRHVAELARVDLDDDEVTTFAAQFAEILADFEELDEVPEVETGADLVNVMRPDETREGLTQEEALLNAPEDEDGFFKGPRVS